MSFDDAELAMVRGGLLAPDQIVGPACMYVPVPMTIDDSLEFREVYCQGWRHALEAVRQIVKPLTLRTEDNRLVKVRPYRPAPGSAYEGLWEETPEDQP